jgi:hypothetical protein
MKKQQQATQQRKEMQKSNNNKIVMEPDFSVMHVRSPNTLFYFSSGQKYVPRISHQTVILYNL